MIPRLAVYATPRIHVRPLPSGLTDYELWFRGEPDRKFYKSAANEFCARRALWLEDTVRRSVGGLPPKNGRPRTVSLLGPAARALELRPPSKRWVWPAPRGGRRAEGKPPTGWHSWVRAAKIGRRIRWHDLRHTCATSLLAGWWGKRKWSIDEVCEHMGHSSVKVTERYARKLSSTTRLAAAATVFPESSPLMLSDYRAPAEKQGRCGWDSNPRITVLQGVSGSSDPAALPASEFPPGNWYDDAAFAAAVIEHSERGRATALRLEPLPAVVKVALFDRARARSVRVA